MISFTIEQRAGHDVAVSHGADPEFCLDKENLETRIKNFLANGWNVEAEQAALAKMNRRAKIQQLLDL